MQPSSPAEVAARLGDTGYLCDDDLATVAFLALSMERPLLVEGEPGPELTLLKCCLRERGIERSGARMTVPWGATLEEVRAALKELAA